MADKLSTSDFDAILGHRLQFVRVLGDGRNARVAEAVDRESGERVAVKVLHAELGASIEADRFMREMAVLQRLEHPRVGALRSAGIAQRRVYYVMPFFEGPTLRQELDRAGRLPAEQVMRIGIELLEAVAHAHAAGVVHRDVEPANIILSPTGAVLIDFGLARAIEVATGDRVTLAGVVNGTSAYMSPEQCRGEDCGAPSDLYSLGCVLFEAIVGHAPFVAEHPITVQLRHLSDPAPPVLSLMPEVPASLARVIDRALEKAPEARWADAPAMLEALRAP